MSGSSPAIDLSSPKFQRLSLLWAKIGRNHSYIGPTDPDRILSQLIARSVAVHPLLSPDLPLLDIGTGVGVPGIPLTLVNPDRPLHLVEPRVGCIGILRWLCSRLGLDDVSIYPDPFENVDFPQNVEFQAVTRATLDWDFFFSDSYPLTYLIRWSGPSVSPPPAREGWVAVHVELSPPFLSDQQEVIWWGEEQLFHVKHSEWDDCPWLNWDRIDLT